MNQQRVALFSVAFELRLQSSARIWMIRSAYLTKPASKYLALLMEFTAGVGEWVLLLT